MRRTALAIGLTAMLAVAGCGSDATPSSGVTSTQLPSASAETGASASPPSSGNPAGGSSAEASSAAASPSASPALKPPPSPAPVCGSANLTARVTGWEGAMGSQIATVLVTNSSATACLLRGTPGLQLVDAAGHILIDSKALGASGLPHVSPGDTLWTMGHLGSLSTMVQVSNYCGATTPVLPTTIALILPSNGGRIVAAANAAGGAPACLGSPGEAGVIAMNGWAKS